MLSLALLSPWVSLGSQGCTGAAPCSPSRIPSSGWSRKYLVGSACSGRKAGFSFLTSAGFSHLNPVLSTLGGKFSDSGRFWTHTQRLEIQ